MVFESPSSDSHRNYPQAELTRSQFIVSNIRYRLFHPTNSFFHNILNEIDDPTLLRVAELYDNRSENLPAQRSEIVLTLILLSSGERCSVEYLQQRTGYAPATIIRKMKALMQNEYSGSRIMGNAQEGYILVAG